jgi:type VI secretion system protein ImpF
MPSVESEQGLMPSILDRLIDPSSEGTAWRHGYSLQQIVDAVRRDLEELLNSHQVYLHLDERWPQLRNSLLSYGMPDLASTNALTINDRQKIGATIETIIRRFEPRLRHVRARVVEEGKGLDRTVRFHLEAQINVDPAPEVAFETVVELTTGHASIKPSEGAS